MQTFVIKERKVTYQKRDVEAETIKFLSVDIKPSMNKLKCSACLKKVGEERPIAVVWAEGRGWRLCNQCSRHLTTNEADKRDTGAKTNPIS